MKTAKTNACRLLDSLKLPYSLLEYPVNEEALDAITVAHSLSLPPEQVFKTLVLTGITTKYFVCIIPGNAELALKHAAQATGNKSCAMLPLSELLPLTGYIKGGCSPLGMKKKFPTFIDSSALNFEQICVSAGKRGLQLFLSPQDLIRAGEITVVSDITIV